MKKKQIILPNSLFLFVFIKIVNCSLFILPREIIKRKISAIFFLLFFYLTGSNLFAQPQWHVYTTQNSGLPSNIIGKVTFDSNNIKWIGTSNGIARFDGVNWIVYDTSNSPLPNISIQDLVFENNKLWVATNGGGVAKFDGINWTIYDTLNSPLPNNKTRFVLIENNIKWIGTLGGLAKYDNLNWTIYKTSNSGLPSNQLWCADIEDSIKWIGTFGHGVAKFDNSNWTVYNFQNSGLPSDAINGQTVDYLGNKWFATMFGGVAKFNSNLNNWTVYNRANSGLPDNNNLSVFTQNHIKWIGTLGGGLAMYNDTSWTVFDPSNSPMPDVSVVCISADRVGNLWIGTGGGLAEYNPNGIIGIERESEQTPELFVLEQNYPNPFNPTTAIHYELSQHSFVRLTIYDIQGIEIKVLKNGFQNRGAYSAIFNAENFPSGIYFYRLSTENFSESKKMILIK